MSIEKVPVQTMQKLELADVRDSGQSFLRLLPEADKVVQILI